MAEIAPRWDLVSIPEVGSVVRQAARNVNNARPNTTEVDDLVQDALIMVATTPGLIAQIEPVLNTGLLYHGLRADLINATEREDRHLRNRVSYERLMGDFAE